eukprot:3523075-Prymnesium_polylepis.1
MVQSIDYKAFLYCKRIKSVTVPAGCKIGCEILGKDVFPAGCNVFTTGELKTAEGIVYASVTETYILMMSDGTPIVRFHNATGELERMEGEEWVPCTLDASGATTSGG